MKTNIQDKEVEDHAASTTGFIKAGQLSLHDTDLALQSKDHPAESKHRSTLFSLWLTRNCLYPLPPKGFPLFPVVTALIGKTCPRQRSPGESPPRFSPDLSYSSTMPPSIHRKRYPVSSSTCCRRDTPLSPFLSSSCREPAARIMPSTIRGGSVPKHKPLHPRIFSLLDPVEKASQSSHPQVRKE